MRAADFSGPSAQNPSLTLSSGDPAVSTQPMLPMRPRIRRIVARFQDYKRHGTTTLFAALDTATGAVIGSCMKRHRAREFRAFLDEVESAVPADLDIHVVMDNASSHKTKLIQDWFAKRPHWHSHFTPTSASWINQVERFFALLTERQIKRGAHRSTAELEAAIQRYETRAQTIPMDQIRRRHPDFHRTDAHSASSMKRVADRLQRPDTNFFRSPLNRFASSMKGAWPMPSWTMRLDLPPGSGSAPGGPEVSPLPTDAEIVRSTATLFWVRAPFRTAPGPGAGRAPPVRRAPTPHRSSC